MFIGACGVTARMEPYKATNITIGEDDNHGSLAGTGYTRGKICPIWGMSMLDIYVGCREGPQERYQGVAAKAIPEGKRTIISLKTWGNNNSA